MSKMKEHLAKLDYFDGVKDGKKDLWKALKFSNEQPDGSLYQAKKMFSYYTSGEVARIAEVELIEYKTLCKERFEDA